MPPFVAPPASRPMDPVVAHTTAPDPAAPVACCVALVCGPWVEVFDPSRLHEIPRAVGDLLAWGHTLADIDLQLLAAGAGDDA